MKQSEMEIDIEKERESIKREADEYELLMQ